MRLYAFSRPRPARDCLLLPISRAGLSTLRPLRGCCGSGGSLAWHSTSSRSFHRKEDVDIGTLPQTSTTASRIHVLGIGNIGKLFAHALAMQDIPPPITLLLHRANLIQDWSEAGRTIEIITAGVSSKGGVFDIEAVHAQPEDLSATKRRGPRDIIHNVIVATKATSTVAAISAIKDRLTHESTILFAQNGMGTAEDVSKIVFPDVATRPRYLACVTSHGVYSQGPFRSVHAGFGSVAIGNVIQDQQSNEDEDSLHKTGNSAYLVKEIVRAPILAAREVSSVVLTQLQLEKLVVNAMLNPLTAIFNLRNGELFTHSKIMRLMRLLLTEASKVIRSLPELQDDPATQKRFSATKLNAVVLDVAEKTAQNTSSMLQDVRAGRQTEIEYINGYIVRRGVQIGVDCSNNYKLVQFIKERCTISDEEIKQHFPDI